MTELAQAIGDTGEPVDDGGGFRPLADVAVPTIYRTNAFRVIGLPVDASPRDITRQSDRLRMADKLGTGAAIAAGPLPLTPAPGGDAIREALQRVRDPEHRLLEEVFWLWPVDPSLKEDPALAALTSGDTTTAITLWREAGGIGAHNLAVMFHASALDFEFQSGELAPEAQRRRDRCWREAFAYWKKAIDNAAVWDRVGARIRDIHDPRLTAATAEHIRTGLARALMAISARLAVAAADRQASEESARHVKYLSESGFEEAVRDHALKTALGPLRQRIATLCKSAQPDADARPERAHEVAARLLDSTEPLLSALKLLRAGHPIRDAAHDEVALAALSCQIVYGNKTSDWVTSVALLKRIIAIVASPSARTRVERNLTIVTQNVELDREVGTCWFCEKAKPDDDAGIEIKMHRDVTRTPTIQGVRINWRTLTLKVPRCAQCKSANTSADTWSVLAFIVCMVVGFGSCGAVGVDYGGVPLGLGGLIVGGFLAWKVHRSTLKGIKSAGAAQSYPGVLRSKDEGWILGEKPADVQS